MNPKLRILTQPLHPDRRIALGSALILFILLGAWRCLDAKGAELSLFRCWQGLAKHVLNAATWTHADLTAFFWWAPITVVATLFIALVAWILGWLLASIVDAFQSVCGKTR